MTRTVVGFVLAAIFIALGLLHVYWAFGGRAGRAASVPTLNGERLFTPSSVGTALVAVGLLACAAVTSGVAGWAHETILSTPFRWLTLAISLVFLVRAIGDWKHVGFFQRDTASAFACWDLRLYSPLCLLLAAGALLLAWSD